MAVPPPDKTLCLDQLQALQAMVKGWGVTAFLAAMFWILQKQDDLGAGHEQPTRLVPFILNDIQRNMLTNLERNNLLLKARQIGGTTFFLLVRGLLEVMTNEGCNALLVSQSREFAEAHFLMAARAYRYFGVRNMRDDRENEINLSFRKNLLHTKYVNRRELYFDNIESRMAVATAEVEESGQGLTLHHLIGSEYARWPKNPAATLANLRGALAPGGTVDLECTANGAVGSFFEKFTVAKVNPINSDSKCHYYSWYFSDDLDMKMNEKEKEELRKDITEDEIRLVAQMHSELHDVSWLRSQPGRVFVP